MTAVPLTFSTLPLRRLTRVLTSYKKNLYRDNLKSPRCGTESFSQFGRAPIVGFCCRCIYKMKSASRFFFRCLKTCHIGERAARQSIPYLRELPARCACQKVQPCKNRAFGCTWHQIVIICSNRMISLRSCFFRRCVHQLRNLFSSPLRFLFDIASLGCGGYSSSPLRDVHFTRLSPQLAGGVLGK
jgi:hypothetical protein